jgi:hypothetical protein
LVHKYYKSIKENKYDNNWYIFYGKLILKPEDFFRYDYPDNVILVEIWISEDKNRWLEFYKDNTNEIRSAIEGTFEFPKSEVLINEPKDIHEMKNIFKKSFEQTLLYKMKILKDIELGNELY